MVPIENMLILGYKSTKCRTQQVASSILSDCATTSLEPKWASIQPKLTLYLFSLSQKSKKLFAACLLCTFSDLENASLFIYFSLTTFIMKWICVEMKITGKKNRCKCLPWWFLFSLSVKSQQAWGLISLCALRCHKQTLTQTHKIHTHARVAKSRLSSWEIDIMMAITVTHWRSPFHREHLVWSLHQVCVDMNAPGFLYGDS